MENKITALLYAEHDNILKTKNILTAINNLWEKDAEKFEKILSGLISFCRNYADQYHHYKEEQLLFPALCETNPMLEGGIVAEMTEHHEIFRELIHDTEECLQKKEYAKAYKEFCKYLELLEDHILIENNELFPMADDVLSPDKQEKIYFEAMDFNSEKNDVATDFCNKLDQLTKEI